MQLGQVFVNPSALSYNNATIDYGSGWSHWTETSLNDEWKGEYIGRAGCASHSMINAPLTVTWKNAGYTSTGQTVGFRLKITSIWISNFDSREENRLWGTNAGWDAFLYWWNGDGMPYFASLDTSKSMEFTIEIIDSSGNRLNYPFRWSFVDLDVTSDGLGTPGKYCTKYNGTYNDNIYAEGVVITGGVSHTYLTNPSYINQTVLSDSGNTWFYGTRDTESNNVDDRRAGFACYAPNGYISGSWRGTRCATGLCGNVYSGRITEMQSPIKSTTSDIVNEGDNVVFNIDQMFPVVPNEAKASSITFSDTLDAAFAAPTTSSLRIYRGSTDVTSNWNISVSGQTITATAKDTGHSSSTSAQYQHRFVLTAKVRSLPDYSRLSKSGDYYLIPNKAAISLNNSSAVISKQTNTVNVRIKGSAISIQKRADSFEHLPNGSVTYRLVVSNTEPNSRASNVRVTDDTLPSTFRIASVNISSPASTATHQILGSAFTATIPRLDYGQPATITVVAIPSTEENGHIVPNTASATFSNPKSSVVATVTDKDHIYVNQASLTIVKTPDKREAHVGDVIHYTLTISNAAAGTIARNIVLEDILPDTMALDKSSIEVSGIPDTVRVPVDGNHKDETWEDQLNNWELDTSSDNGFSLSAQMLDSASTVTISYAALAQENGNGTYSFNCANISSDNSILPAPIEEEVFINDPQIEIEKEADQFEYVPGDEVTYTVRVRQLVDGAIARNVMIRDDLPQYLTLVPDSITAQVPTGSVKAIDVRPPHQLSDAEHEQYANATVSTRGNIFQINVPVLGYGEDLIVTYKARANDDSAGTHVVNTATATFSNIAADDMLDYPVRASDDVWINDSRMKVVKTADKYEYRVGEKAHFTIGLHNDIGADGTIAYDVVLADEQRPQDFHIDFSSIKVSGVPSPIHYPVDGSGSPRNETRDNIYKISPNDTGNGFVLDIPYFPDNASVTVEYDAVAVKEINGLDALNYARIDAGNPNDPGDDAQTGIWTNDARLRITKSTDEFEHKVGDIVDYTLSLSNIAPGTVAKNVVVEDISLPNGAVLIPESVQVTGISDPISYKIAPNGQYEEKDNPISITNDGNGLKIMIPYLSSTDVAKICYKVRMDEPVNGTVVKNTAQVSCDNLVPDQDLSDLSDNEIVYVNTPKLQMSKTTLTPEIHVGQQARFQIDVENIVTGSIAGVPVVLEDTLPEGLSFVPGSIEISGLPDEISYPVRDEEKTGSATEVRDNRAIISENAEGRSFSISIPYLPSGCKVTVTYAATSLDSSNGYHLVNTARLTSPNCPEDEDSTSEVFVNSPEVNIIKNADGHEYRIGDIITYTVDITSSCPGTIARNVLVSDDIPAHFELIAGSAHIINTLAGTVDAIVEELPGNAGKVTCSISELPYGTCTLVYQVRALEDSRGERFINTAELVFENVPPAESSSYPKQDKDDVWINDAISHIDKASDKFEYEVGDIAHFTLGVSNDSASGTIARNVMINDSQLPEDFTIDMSSIRINGIPVSVSYPIDGNGSLSEEMRDNAWEIIPHENGSGFELQMKYLPQGALITIEYNAVANREINGIDALNKAFVESDNPNDPGDDAEVHIWVNTADLTLDKAVDASEHRIGDEVEYTLILRNMAAGTVAKDVYITDVSLPSYLSLINDSVNVSGWNETVSYPEAGDNFERVLVEKENFCDILYEGSDNFDEKIAELSYSNHWYNYENSNHVAEENSKNNMRTGNGFIVKIGYLPAGETITITYKAIVEEDANGKNVENFASADCENGTPHIPQTDPDNSNDPEIPDAPEIPDTPGSGTAPDADTAVKGPVHALALVDINEPDISISKTSSTNFAHVGDTVHYVLTVNNAAAGTVARNIIIKDNMAPYLGSAYDNISVYGRYIAEDGNSIEENIEQVAVHTTDKGIEIATGASLISEDALVEVRNRNELSSSSPNMDGERKYREIIVEYDMKIIDKMSASSYRNIAVAVPENGASSEDTEELYVESIKHGSQVTMYKSSDPASGTLVEEGQKINYSLRIKNTGTSTAPFVIARDYIPQGAVFENVSDDGVFVGNDKIMETNNNFDDQTVKTDESKSANISEDQKNGYVEWVISNLAPNEEATLHYSITVDDESVLPLYIRNIARYECTNENPGMPGSISPDFMPAYETNEVIHSTDPDHPCPAVLDLEKNADPKPGSIVHWEDEITYTLTLRNNGGQAATSAGIRDYVSDFLDVDVSTISDNGTWNAETRSIDWIFDIIKPGEVVTVSYTAKVNHISTPDDIIANQALFENNWNPEKGDPSNSSNIVEHPSGGKALVADEFIEISDTGNAFPLLTISMSVIAACTILAEIGKRRRRS